MPGFGDEEYGGGYPDPYDEAYRRRLSQQLAPSPATPAPSAVPRARVPGQTAPLPPSPPSPINNPNYVTELNAWRQQQSPSGRPMPAGGAPSPGASFGPQHEPGGIVGPPPATTAEDPRALFQRLSAGLSPSSQSLQSLAPQLQAAGIRLGRANAMGLIDSIILPNGREIDVGQSFSGAPGTQRWQWMGSLAGRAAGRPAGSVGMAGAQVGAPSMSAADTSFRDQIRSMLMSQLTGLSKPVTGEESDIAGQLSVQERGLERNRRERRAAMAERMAASGLNSGGAGSGALESEIASGFENKGEAMSGLRAQLVGRELQSRRAQMSQLLQTALATGDADAARALQLQMAQMDDALRRMQIGESGRQWNDQFGLSAGRFQYEKDRELAGYGAGA